MPGDGEGRDQGAEHAPGDGDRLLGAGDSLVQDGELVPSQPRHGVRRPHRRTQTVADGDQEMVTGRVTEAVVDELEVIEIEGEEGGARGVAARQAIQRATEPIGEEGAIDQPRQHVVEREVPHPRLGLGTFHRVPDGPAELPSVDLALHQVVLRTLAQRLESQVLVGVSGQHDDGDIRRGEAHRPQPVEALGVGEGEVEEDARGLLEERHRVGEARHRGDVEELPHRAASQQRLHELGVAGAVLDDEQRGTLDGRASRGAPRLAGEVNHDPLLFHGMAKAHSSVLRAESCCIAPPRGRDARHLSDSVSKHRYRRPLHVSSDSLNLDGTDGDLG